MRRALAGVLILMCATCAQAGLVFTVNGEVADPEYIYHETYELGLDMEPGTVSDYVLDYVLSSDGAEFDHSGTVFSNNPPWFVGNGYIGVPDPQSFRISGSNFQIPYTGDWIMHGLVLNHLDSFEDIILTVTTPGGTYIDGEPVPPGTVMQSIIFHGVPEPASMMLFGFGSILILRRRKR